MKRILLLFSIFFSLSFYGQNDTLPVVKPPTEIVESVDTTQIVYRGLDNKFSIFRLNDTISIVNNSNISLVSADKTNVVYRGLENPISIVVPNCKSFEASGNYLYKYAEGKYKLLPGSGIESKIILDIVLNDGSNKKEVYTFRIKNIPHLSGKINGLYCNQSIIVMTKKELTNAEISIGFPKDFLYELKFNLVSFAVKIKEKYIYISGNTLNKEALDLIKKLPLNSIFEITYFKSDINCTNCSSINIQPLKIMLVDDKTDIGEK